MMQRAGERRTRHEAGGVVAAVAIVLATAATAVGVMTLGSALAARQRVVDAADAAALAAADAASGAVAGVPCELADRVARANGAVTVDCRVDGVVASVTAAADVLGVRVVATARAGPPDSA